MAHEGLICSCPGRSDWAPRRSCRGRSSTWGNREGGEFLRSPAAREKFPAINVNLMPSTPEEMAERIRSEIPIYSNAMRVAGIEPE